MPSLPCRFIVLCAALFGALSPAIAQVCRKQSPPHTVALLELYTSEGCSSCPPADRFISNLSATRSPELGLDQVVPLSLHVDYWNDIGWKDRFSQPLFTQRQRWLSGLVGSRTIYTPEVFVSGHELRSWSNGTRAAVEQINARPAQAAITISLGAFASNAVPVDITATSAKNGSLYVALYENALNTDVKAGENRGVQLHHDYVVHQWIGPVPLVGGSAGIKRSLPYSSAARRDHLGIAAFVQSDQGEVLQALALPACS